MEDSKLKKTIKEAILTQFELFGKPTVSKVKKPRRKMSEKEKEERKAQLALQKKIEADKRFEEYWAKRGVFQGELFPEE